MSSEHTGPIATRRLTLVSSGRAVLLEFEAPKPRRGDEWACVYHIRGLGRARTGRALGEDGLQALQLAMMAVRRTLEPFAARLTWTGEPGELGLPEQVPDYFGGEFRRRMEGLVRRETEVEARRLKALAVGKSR